MVAKPTMAASEEMSHLQAWVGRSEAAEDHARGAVYDALAALLDHDEAPWPKGEAPLLGHWLHFPPTAAQSALGVDGHPRQGEFLPPVSAPRRMWAGGDVAFLAPIARESHLRRRSTVEAIETKRGTSGALTFVKVGHQVWSDGRLAIRETQNLVYRGPGEPGNASSAEAPVRPSPCGQRTVRPDPTLLFRFSALTFNAHRIHYDRDYACGVEGYPGLVVQAPLTATLLMDHGRRLHPDLRIRRFAFRARRPLYDTAPFQLDAERSAAGLRLVAFDPQGAVAMEASAEAEDR